jgi:RNA polymerase sigma factor (sigma-70 family)
LSAVPHIGHAHGPRRDGAEAAAASSLYERFSGQIYGYCLHQLGSREEAEDALQTTFMNAFRGLQRGVVPKVESAWLFKIAHNVCLSRRRSSRRRGRVEAPNNLEVIQEIVPAREEAGDELIGLQAALDSMPEGQQRAILLREWQGLSYREIAAELGLSQSAVETLIFRARRSLAQGLEEEQPAERRWRRRARHGLDAGAVLTALKGLFAGGAAVKVVATAALATTALIAATDSTHHPRTGPRRTQIAPAAASGETTHAQAPVSIAPPVAHRAPRPALARPSHARTSRPVSQPTASRPHAEPATSAPTAAARPAPNGPATRENAPAPAAAEPKTVAPDGNAEPPLDSTPAPAPQPEPPVAASTGAGKSGPPDGHGKPDGSRGKTH